MMSGKAMRKVAFALLGLALLREVAGHRHGCRYEDEEEGGPETEHAREHHAFARHHGPWRHMRFGHGFGPAGADKDWVPPMVEEWHRRMHEREAAGDERVNV